MAVPLSLLTFAKEIFPPPQSRQTQAIRFTAGKVLRGKFEETTANLETPDQILPQLGLEKLRELVTLCTRRQVAEASGNLDDERERDG